MVRRRSARASALIREAVVRDVNGNEIVLVFRHTAHANMFPAQSELLAEAVHEVLGGTWRVRAELGGDGRPEPTRSPSAGHPTDPAPTGGPARGAAGRGTAGPPAGGAPDDTGWPEPARPGGDAAKPQQRAGGGAPPARAAANASQRASDATAPNRAAGTAPQRRGGAPSAAGSRPSSAQRPDAAGRSAPRPSSAAPARADARAPRPAVDDEPPWDREYEPAEYVPTYEGFDPGDEPLDDDAQPNVPIASAEDRAIQLLSEQLGAERISDP
jgi:DNA polymerase-3 subunit gamma/tau